MKILQMARWFFPHVGGATIRVYNIAKYLTEFGYEVHLLTHNPKSIEQCNLNEEAPLYEKHPDGFYVYRLPYYDLPAGKNIFNWAASIPVMAKKAIEIINENDIDIILSHNPPYLVGTASLIASRRTKKPMVINVHDVWGAEHYGFVKYRIGDFLQKFCVNRTKNFVTASEGLKKIFSQELNVKQDNIFVAPNAINLEHFKIDNDKFDSVIKKYEKLGIKKGVDYIFFVGIMRKWAGINFLIESFAKIINENKNLRFNKDNLKLLLVGGGGDKPEFEKLASDLKISDKVIFTDSVPYEDVPYLISIATVTCAPFPSSRVTDNEKLMSPHKVLEYLAMGKPTVASAVGGMENYIKDNETGILFEPDNLDELTEKIIYLLENPKIRNKISENAYKYIRSGGFEWKNSVKIVESILLKTVAESKNE